MDFYAEELTKTCRVCGKRIHKAKGGRERKYIARDCQSDILEVFHIDVTDDNDTIHPLHFCQPCRAFISCWKSKKALPVDRVFTWSKHTETDCRVSQIKLPYPSNSITP